jgi:hypothetical protein
MCLINAISINDAGTFIIKFRKIQSYIFVSFKNLYSVVLYNKLECLNAYYQKPVEIRINM